MKLKRVSLETARLLKEKGFNLNTDYLYFKGKLSKEREIQNTNWNGVGECHVSAPPIALAIEWIREKLSCIIEARAIKDRFNEIGTSYQPYINTYKVLEPFKTFDEALEAGIISVLTPEEDRKLFKLKKEIGEKWLAALRSGEYEQGTGFLKYKENTEEGEKEKEESAYKYCCLGVLGEVLKVKNEHLIGETFPKPCTKYPKEVIDKDFTDFLAKLNDGVTYYTQILYPDLKLERRIYTFEEIANIIEANTKFY